MKLILTFLVLALAATASFGATLNPVQLLNPVGSTAGQAIVSTGASTAPAWGTVTAGSLSPVAANTVIANFTGSTAAPVAFTMPTCSAAGRALQYSGSGIVCTSNYALTTNTLAQFAATTSAQLAGIVSDETGSGSLVFGTSPTIGTPAISGGTISGATVTTGSINNAPIGATTANTGKFTTLQATSAAHLLYTNASAQSFASGTAATVTTWVSNYDLNSNFNGTTGTFTAPSAGYYKVSGQLVFATGSAAAGTVFQALVLKNGSAVITGWNTLAVSTQGSIVVQFSVDLSLAASDTVTIQGKQNSGASLALSGGPSVNFINITQIP